MEIKKKVKLNLNELKVQSFVTTIEKDKLDQLVGGASRPTTLGATCTCSCNGTLCTGGSRCCA